jgi:hypothetical protein
VRRAQIHVGGRWQHRANSRVAIITWIVYPHFVEYKYEQPTRRGSDPWHGPVGTEPYTRRTRVSYRRFILNFDFKRKS